MESNFSYIIRKATPEDAEGITLVHVNSWKTSYAGIIDASFLEAINYEKRLALRKKISTSTNTLHLVAVLDDHIVGFVDAGPIREEQVPGKGEVYALYLLDQYKGKGVGASLFKGCRTWFHQHRMTSFVVWVLADNLKARWFYEKEGGKIMGEKMSDIGGKLYKEYCYFFVA